jgi:hypothetical protein
VSDIEQLNEAVRTFYGHLSARRLAECYRMVDPRVTGRDGGIDLRTYACGVLNFLAVAGPPLVIDACELHIRSGPTAMYEERDFAHGVTHLRDGHARPYTLQERWVLENGLWYTRCVGFANPA